jgi:hypothetical protein
VAAFVDGAGETVTDAAAAAMKVETQSVVAGRLVPLGSSIILTLA